MFFNSADDCSVMAHGNDFVAVGNEKSTEKWQKTLEATYKVKHKVLGGGAE